MANAAHPRSFRLDEQDEPGSNEVMASEWRNITKTNIKTNPEWLPFIKNLMTKPLTDIHPHMIDDLVSLRSSAAQTGVTGAEMKGVEMSCRQHSKELE